jgi:rod shape-determining protein MreC
VRSIIGGLVSPIYVVAESPYLLSDAVGDVLASRDELQHRNSELERRVLELSQISQQYVALKAENDRLRELLGSQGRLPYEVLIAELVGVIPDPDTFQIIIDKGADAGISVGQAVLDAEGLFGQVVEVNRFTSRVLLVTDRDHAVPVRINRNGVRSIAGGTGDKDSLVLENVSISADIVEGDRVETSGLGGRFPPGYPVGTVASVVVEPTSAYAQVLVRPAALLDRSRHVLVIFSPRAEPEDTAAEAGGAP